MLITAVYYRLPLAGFGETGDFVMAFATRTLADLGLDRLEIAGALGGPELNYTLVYNPPIALVAHATLFRFLGGSPSVQIAFSLFLHLLVVLSVMLVARSWRKNHPGVLTAGFLVAIHPLVTGTVPSMGGLSVLLSTLFVMITLALVSHYAHTGSRGLLGPLLLTGLFAAACDTAGLMVIPAAILATIVVPQRKQPVNVLRLILAPLMVTLGVTIPIAYIAFTSGPPVYLYQLTQLSVAKFGHYAAWALRGLFVPADWTLGSEREWLGVFLIALLGALTFSLTVYRALRRPALLIWPALTFAAFLARGFALDMPAPTAASEVFAACYLPLAFLGLWVAELAPTGEFRVWRASFIVLILLIFVPQSYYLVQIRSQQAEQVNHLGKEINNLLVDAPMGADVIFPARPTKISLIEAAFLSGQYQAAAEQQIRYRLLVGGRIQAAPRKTKLGQEFNQWIRLPFTSQNMVLGLTADQQHFTDLTKVIHAKITLANDVIKNEGHVPPPWPLIDESTVDKWDVGAGCRDMESITSADAVWFFEGFLYRLHPHIGRVGM
ncbi:MAG: hypothetical protein ACTSXZ_06705 [Alphaproteobacteria bacterium]